MAGRAVILLYQLYDTSAIKWQKILWYSSDTIKNSPKMTMSYKVANWYWANIGSKLPRVPIRWAAFDQGWPKIGRLLWKSCLCQHWAEGRPTYPPVGHKDLFPILGYRTPLCSLTTPFAEDRSKADSAALSTSKRICDYLWRPITVEGTVESKSTSLSTTLRPTTEKSLIQNQLKYKGPEVTFFGLFTNWTSHQAAVKTKLQSILIKPNIIT